MRSRLRNSDCDTIARLEKLLAREPSESQFSSLQLDGWRLGRQPSRYPSCRNGYASLKKHFGTARMDASSEGELSTLEKM
jgi:hypothetical protein